MRLDLLPCLQIWTVSIGSLIIFVQTVYDCSYNSWLLPDRMPLPPNCNLLYWFFLHLGLSKQFWILLLLNRLWIFRGCVRCRMLLEQWAELSIPSFIIFCHSLTLLHHLGLWMWTPPSILFSPLQYMYHCSFPLI